MPLILTTRFNPRKIAGLQLWLRAGRITDVADGGAITTWIDESGRNYHCTQVTADNKPTYQGNELNSLPIVRFDGSNDSLGRADGGETNFTAVTIFAVQKLLVDPATTNAFPWAVGDSLATTGEKLFWVSGPTFGGSAAVVDVAAHNNQHKRATLTGISAQNAWKIIAFVVPGDHNDSTAFADGVAAVMSLAPVATFNLNVAFFVGGASATDVGQVDLAEIIVYNSALSAANRQRVERYLSKKYNITLFR